MDRRRSSASNAPPSPAISAVSSVSSTSSYFYPHRSSRGAVEIDRYSTASFVSLPFDLPSEFPMPSDPQACLPAGESHAAVPGEGGPVVVVDIPSDDVPTEGLPPHDPLANTVSQSQHPADILLQHHRQTHAQVQVQTLSQPELHPAHVHHLDSDADALHHQPADLPPERSFTKSFTSPYPATAAWTDTTALSDHEDENLLTVNSVGSNLAHHFYLLRESRNDHLSPDRRTPNASRLSVLSARSSQLKDGISKTMSTAYQAAHKSGLFGESMYPNPRSRPTSRAPSRSASRSASRRTSPADRTRRRARTASQLGSQPNSPTHSPFSTPPSSQPSSQPDSMPQSRPNSRPSSIRAHRLHHASRPRSAASLSSILSADDVQVDDQISPAQIHAIELFQKINQLSRSPSVQSGHSVRSVHSIADSIASIPHVRFDVDDRIETEESVWPTGTPYRKSDTNDFVKTPSVQTIIDGVPQIDIVKRQDFLIKLTRAFTSCGAPSHRLEYHLQQLSQILDVPSEFAVLPGIVMISFGREDHTSKTHIVKTPQGFHMGKLTDINRLCLDVAEYRITITDAFVRLNEILTAPSTPLWVHFIIQPVMGSTFCLLGFGGRWIDAAISLFMGVVMAGWMMLGSRYPSVTYLVEFMSSFTIAFLGRLFQWLLHIYSPDTCFNYIAVVFSGLAVLLPGLALTNAMTELSTRNMISGTVKTFQALFVAMIIGFGMSMGSAVAIFQPNATNQLSTQAICSEPVSPYWGFLIFPLLTISVNMLFEAYPPQWPVMSLVSALGYLTSFFLSKVPAFTGQNTSAVTVASAMVVGLGGNVYARITGDVAVAPILASIFLQVPGSVGVMSSLGFFGSNIIDGTTFAFKMLLVGMSITMGLFIATLIVWPVKGPRLKYMTF